MKKLFLILTIALFVASEAWAATLYVDNNTVSCTTPSDSDYDPATRSCGSGSYAVYDSIQGAADNTSAGDTVLIREGTYKEKVSPPQSGTSGNWITYEAYDDENVMIKSGSAWGLILSTDYDLEYLYFKNIHIQADNDTKGFGAGCNETIKKHIVLDGLEIDGALMGTQLWGGVDEIEIKNCTFKNNQIGLYTTSTSNINIDNNTFQDGKVYDSSIGRDHIRIHTNHGSTEQIENTMNTNVKIRDNTVKGAVRQGILVFTADKVLVSGNHCYKNGATGIQIEGDGSCSIVGTNIVVENNICEYNSQTYGGEAGIWIDDTDNVTVQNNIMRYNETGLRITGTFNVIARNNLIYENTCDDSNDNCSSSAGVWLKSSAHNREEVWDSAGADNIIVHNTIHRNGHWRVNGYPYAQVVINYLGGDLYPNIYDTVFKNNIVSESLSENPELDLRVDNSTHSLDYNNYHPTSRSLQISWKQDRDTSTIFSWDDYVSESDNDTHSIVAPPLFTAYDPNDLDNADFNLKANSACIESGGFLTTATNSGSNSKELEIDDARYFSDGYGVIAGDLIQINSDVRRAVTVTYSNNTIMLDNETSWSIGDPVSYPYEGSRPDIGAHEYPEDNDTDADSIIDIYDNCPYNSNSDQDDTDNDTIGDVCDNCPIVANLDQADYDSDGIGYACDYCLEYTSTVQEHLDAGRAVAFGSYRWAVGSNKEICRDACDNDVVTFYEEGFGVPEYYFIDSCEEYMLQAHWKFDESSGTTASDSSGNGNDGTLYDNETIDNGPVWTTGKINGALEFDGIDDYVDVGTDCFDLTSELTVSLWINMADNDTEQVLISRGVARPFKLRLASNNEVVATIRTDNSTHLESETSLDTINQWYHVALTYGGGSMIIYIDGAPDVSVSKSGDLDCLADKHTAIGALPGVTYPFEGLIDDVRIYNRALSADEIAGIYGSGAGQ